MLGCDVQDTTQEASPEYYCVSTPADTCTDVGPDPFQNCEGSNNTLLGPADSQQSYCLSYVAGIAWCCAFREDVAKSLFCACRYGL